MPASATSASWAKQARELAVWCGRPEWNGPAFFTLGAPLPTKKKKTKPNPLAEAKTAFADILRPGIEIRVADIPRRVLCRAINEATFEVYAVYQVGNTGEIVLSPAEDWKNPHGPVPRNNKDWLLCPKAGTHWKHFKGDTYRIVSHAVHVKTGKLFVVYKADRDKTVWARGLADWLTPVKEGCVSVPRFTRIG